MESTAPAESIHHHRRRMRGRDPHEAHRVATPLELLFDLTFVSAFGLAAAQFAHAVAAGHVASGLMGFAFAGFAICWAWINFSWFASAYDTDDWVFRIVTMVQMTGVLVLAIGIPPMFASIEHGVHLDNRVIVLGYVIMRLAMLFQWLRAARADPAHRRACLTYAAVLAVTQLGWISQIILDLPVRQALLIAGVLVLIEMAGPILAERQDGGTPWHAHHIAERYSLFAIIALGEGVVGTVATLSAVVQAQGWTTDVALVCLAGTGLTFALWWVYYMLPSAEVLHVHRERSFVWGYGQMLLIVSIVAAGAGLDVAAYYIGGEAKIGAVGAVLAVAIPVGLFLAGIYALYAYMLRSFDRFHLLLMALTGLVVAAAIAAALAGVSMPVCLVILTLAPVVTVLGYELHGYHHRTAALARVQRQ